MWGTFHSLQQHYESDELRSEVVQIEMEFKFTPDYDVTIDGINYRVIKTKEDVDRCVDVYFKVFMQGKTQETP